MALVMLWWPWQDLVLDAEGGGTDAEKLWHVVAC